MSSREGKLVKMIPQRGFGIIETKVDYRVERFWMHTSRINVCVPDEPTEGCHVKFDVSEAPPKRSGDLPAALNVEIYPPVTSAPVTSMPVTTVAEKNVTEVL